MTWEGCHEEEKRWVAGGRAATAKKQLLKHERIVLGGHREEEGRTKERDTEEGRKFINLSYQQKEGWLF